VQTAVSVVRYIRGKPRERWISDKHSKQIRRQNIKEWIKKLRNYVRKIRPSG